MQITHTRCDAAAGFGAVVGAANISSDKISSDPAPEGASFDPEAIDLMQAALDDAWASVRPAQRACASLSVLASRVLDLAARGVRDHARLRAFALDGVDGLGRLRLAQTANFPTSELGTPIVVN
jgi:hypothetical protein